MSFFKELFQKKQKTKPVPTVQVPQSKPKNAETIIQTTKTAPKAEVYEMCLKDDYVCIYKNDKEIFDGDIRFYSSSGKYMIATGFRNETESIALFSANDLVAIRKFDDDIEKALITDDGKSYIYTDNDYFLVMNRESTSYKDIGFSTNDEGVILGEDFCLFSGFDGDTVFLKCYNVIEGRTWKKEIEIGEDIDFDECDVVLTKENDTLIVTLEGNEVLRATLDGKLVK